MTTDPAAEPSSPFDTARALRLAWRSLAARAPTVIGVMLAVVVGPEIAAFSAIYLADGAGGSYQIASAVVGLTGGCLATATITYLLLVELTGERVTWLDSLRVGGRAFLGVTGVSVIVAIGTMLGALLLVVPGIFVAVCCFVAIPYRVANGPGVMDAIKFSTALTKGSRWRLFGLLLISLLIHGGLTGMAWGLQTAAGAIAGETALVPVSLVVGPIADGLKNLATITIAAAAYHELVHRGRDAITRTANVFD